MTLASSPTRISAVMIASRTRGTCSAPSAAASAGTASAAAERTRGAPADFGIRAVQCRNVRRQWHSAGRRARRRRWSGGTAFNEWHGPPPVRRWRSAISSTGRTNSAPPFLHELARHAPDDGGRFCLGNGAAAAPVQFGHRIRAVAAHSGHQHADQLPGVIMLERARHHALHARMPRIVALRRHRHRNHARRRAGPRSSRRRRGRYRSCRPRNGIGRLTSTTRSSHCRSSRLANGPVKLAGMCCATTHGPRKSGGSCGSTTSSAAGPPVDVPIRTSAVRRDWPCLPRPDARAVAPGRGRTPAPRN